jgi:hypothetical protein
VTMPREVHHPALAKADSADSLEGACGHVWESGATHVCDKAPHEPWVLHHCTCGERKKEARR